MPVTIKDKVEQALATYKAQNIYSTVYEEYKGFNIYCMIQGKQLCIEAVERLPLTGMYEVSVSSTTSYNVQEGKTCEMHRCIYLCNIRSILRTVTIALEHIME